LECGLESSIAGLKALLPLIENMPVSMALEPHYHSQYQDAEDYDMVFSAIQHPKVGITIDTGHFHSAGVDTLAFIRKYAGKIWNVHLKDHVGTESVAIGKGEIDLKGIIEALYEINYEGPLALELKVKDKENLSKYVAEAYIYLRDMILKVTDQDSSTY
jgi:sugar phosphate isomerase/epimerase